MDGPLMLREGPCVNGDLQLLMKLEDVTDIFECDMGGYRHFPQSEGDDEEADNSGRYTRLCC